MNTQSTIKRLTVGKYSYIIVHYKIKQNLLRTNTLLTWYDEHMTTDGRYKSTAPVEDYQAKNRIILKHKSDMDGYLMYNRGTERKLPTQAGLIEYLNNKTHNYELYAINTPKGKEVTTYFAQMIAEKKNSRAISTGTLGHLTSQLNRLKKYEDTLSKKLTFDDINLTFSGKYTAWMFQNDMKAGTINKAFDILKGMLKYYEERPEHNITVNPAYKVREFNNQRKSENLPKPLTREEFNKLLVFEFEDKKLSLIRDLFLLACTTGIRYSDLFRIDSTMVYNDCLNISPTKTANRKKQEKNLLKINLNDISRTILLKHHNNTTQYYMNADMYRTAIRNMCKAAGINDYASHSCRDTFITFCVENNVSIPILMSWTGHTKYEDLAKYIRINEQQKDREMQQVTVFKLTAQEATGDTINK